MPLRKDVKSPLAARNDAEKAAVDTDTEKKPDEKKADEKKPEEKKPEAAGAKPPATPAVDIDLDGFEARAVVLPPKAGNYADLQAIKGKLLYRRAPRTGSARRQDPDRLLRPRGARGEDGPRRRRRRSR